MRAGFTVAAARLRARAWAAPVAIPVLVALGLCASSPNGAGVAAAGSPATDPATISGTGAVEADARRQRRARRPSVSVRPRKVAQGRRIRIVGRHWPARKRVGLYVGVPQSEAFRVGRVRANGRGRFKRRIGPVNGKPGPYVALACRPVKSCRRSARARFRVLPG